MDIGLNLNISMLLVMVDSWKEILLFLIDLCISLFDNISFSTSNEEFLFMSKETIIFDKLSFIITNKY